MQAGDILDTELASLQPGVVPDILYMIAIFEGHHTNRYEGPA